MLNDYGRCKNDLLNSKTETREESKAVRQRIPSKRLCIHLAGRTPILSGLYHVQVFLASSQAQSSAYPISRCASLLINNGFGLKDVQEWLGHSDIKMMANIYGHLDVARKQSIANMLSGSLATPW